MIANEHPGRFGLRWNGEVTPTFLWTAFVAVVALIVFGIRGDERSTATQAQLTAMSVQISGLESSVKGQIERLSAELRAVPTQISGLQAEMARHETKDNHLESRIAELERTTAAMSALVNQTLRK